MLWPYLVLVILLGACVGSFLNVVIYRLPAGESLVRPGSRCPSCHTALQWYDNLPVVGWIFLGGRCRYCKVKISVQYPLIEALTAGLFALVFVIYYMTPWCEAFGGRLMSTWPVLVVHLVLVGGLVASTVIDARLFIIPLQITWWVAGVALVVYAGAAALGLDVSAPAAGTFTYGVFDERRVLGPYPRVGLGAAGVALGGLVGLGAANLLLWKGVLPMSFAEDETEREAEWIRAMLVAALGEESEAGEASGSDEPAGTGDDPEVWLHHPHARREAMKEVLFLALPMVGLVAGWWIFGGVDDGAQTGRVAEVGRGVGGVVMGYLVGGAVVWGVRVLGTLSFGKEAMGLGDVHLLAAVGAVCGWRLAVLAFFAAPFFGLAYAGVTAALGSILHRQVRVIPYGPHLAIATVGVMLLRDPLMRYFGAMMGL